MHAEEIAILLKELIGKVNRLSEDVKKVVTEYQKLNYDKRKEVRPLLKELASAIHKCFKAAGSGWWHKWGHYVIGWGIGVFCIGIPLVLGWLKILFE